jgi:hypothetical protein
MSIHGNAPSEKEKGVDEGKSIRELLTEAMEDHDGDLSDRALVEKEQKEAAGSDDAEAAREGQAEDHEKVPEGDGEAQAGERESTQEDPEDDAEGEREDADGPGGRKDETPGGLEPLDHWTQKDKDFFKTLPQESQEFLIGRDKKFQENARRAEEQWAGIRRALDPISEDLVAAGISPEDGIRQFVAMHKGMASEDRNQQLQAALGVLKAYQIPVEALTDPDVLKETPQDARVKELEQRQAQMEHAARMERTRQNQAKLDEFRNSGKAEFFDEAEPAMYQIAVQHLRSGQPVPALEQLYETACMLTPTLRERYLQSQINRETQKSDEADRAKKAAKASSVDVESKPAAEKEKEYPTDLRSQLEYEWKRSVSRG